MGFFIPAELIARARKAVCEESGPLVIGYDPAWTGGDRHAMAFRRGRRLIKVETRMHLDTVEAAGWLKQVIDRERPAKVFIDVGGVGAGVYDQLQHMGPPYAETVEAVNFGSPPFEPAPLDELGRPSGGPLNRRAEVWGKSKEWLELPGGVQIPDSDSLQADACGPTYRYDSLTRLVLERKEDMRRRGRGGAHLCQAGGGAGAEEAEQFSPEAGVSADGVGVRADGYLLRSCSWLEETFGRPVF